MTTASPLGEPRTARAGDTEIRFHVAGQGKLVILMHGWPEQSFSWRHQVPALVAAGYRVATVDMRGYGASAKPEDPAAYRLNTIAQDIGAVADALGAERWVTVGHDWGAIAAWRTALFYPQRVEAVFCMSVPHSGPPPIPFLQILDHLYPETFFYIRYFQPVGVAEAELDAADTATALRQIYYTASGEGVRATKPRHAPRNATLLQAWEAPPQGPLPFLPDDELAVYAAAFEEGGWRGPLNYYRNFEANADEVRALGDSVVHQPSGFLYGEFDPVLKFVSGQLETQRKFLSDLRMEVCVPAAGHWVQQEAPEAVNAALLQFLAQL